MKVKHILPIFILIATALYSEGFYQERHSAVKIIWEPQLIKLPDIFSSVGELVKKPVSDFQLKASLAVVLKFLQKYPSEFLKKNLKKIHILGDLAYQDVSYKGLFDRSNLYVVYDGLQKRDDYRPVENALHYYFCHLLFENFREQFNLEAWNSLNPEGFEYNNDHGEIYKMSDIPVNLQTMPFAPEFLYHSSSHSIEEDFAGIARNLFLADPYFWKIAGENEIIRRKTELALNFFRKLHPQFTRSFFRSTSAY